MPDKENVCLRIAIRDEPYCHEVDGHALACSGLPLAQISDRLVPITDPAASLPLCPACNSRREEMKEAAAESKQRKANIFEAPCPNCGQECRVDSIVCPKCGRNRPHAID